MIKPDSTEISEDLSRQTRLISLDSLRLSDWNPRAISKERYDNLRKTILADPSWLWARPICAQADGTIYAGHQRWTVLNDLWGKNSREWRLRAADAGIAPGTTPGVVGDVPELLAWERGMRDNAQWGDFDDAKLLAHMQNMADAGSDLTLLGFDDDALRTFQPDAGAPELDPGDGEGEGKTTPLDEPVTQPGDIWTLGRHRLACIDAEDEVGVRRLMDGMSVDAVISDLPCDEPQLFDATSILATFANVKEIFLFGAIHGTDTLPLYGREGSWVCWDKGSDVSDGPEFELIWSKRQHKWRILRHEWQAFLTSDGLERGERIHPQQKPVVLIHDMLAQWITESATVADLYAGSGSVLIACEQTGRACLSAEIEQAYCDAIVQRWEALTRLEAVNQDGSTFRQLQDRLSG